MITRVFIGYGLTAKPIKLQEQPPDEDQRHAAMCTVEDSSSNVLKLNVST